jgi:hypothetical protein
LPEAKAKLSISERTETSQVAGVHAGGDGPFLQQDTPNSVETGAQYNVN